MKFEEEMKRLEGLHDKGELAGCFNISNEAYHASPGISNTGLGHIEKSPAHYLDHKQSPSADTKALRDGRRLHVAVLEPDQYELRYAVEPECDGRTKEGKLKLKEFEELCLAENKTPVSPKDHENTLRQRDAVHRSNGARQLLVGHRELSFYATDPETGVLGKARPDIVHPGGVIADLKKTQDASPSEMARSIINWGYDRQAAFHRDIVNLAMLQSKTESLYKIPKIDTSVLICVEDKKPYGVALYTFSLGWLERGFNKYKKALETYSQCTKLNKWPCYPDEIIELEPPEWAQGEF